MKTKLLILLIPLLALAGLLQALQYQATQTPEWTQEEIDLLQSLWIKNLPPKPPSYSNAVANDPVAAQLGHHIFFDTRFSKHNNVACATCHQPQRKFTDGLQLAQGTRVGERNTMSIVGAMYSPWYFWNGRKDSLWSQALGPLESEIEHGGHRFQYAMLLSLDNDYRALYQAVFGSFPDISSDDKVAEVFVNMGKSLEAYERNILPGVSRFDNYVDSLVTGREYPRHELLNAQELAGLKVFINAGQCLNCHNGPMFSNFAFHNTGVFPNSGAIPDLGRARGVNLIKQDNFNCLGEFSDDTEHRCDELNYMKEGKELLGTQKTPSLRALIGTEPYMHAGQFATLQEVLIHYNEAGRAVIGHNEAKPLNLPFYQLQQMEAFLHSLDAPINADPMWLRPPAGMEEGSNLSRISNSY